jgi:hypothetical protein
MGDNEEAKEMESRGNREFMSGEMADDVLTTIFALII